MTLRPSLALFLVAALAPACHDAPTTGSSSSSVSSQNALSFNRLSMNRLSMNRLSMNRLSMNRLSMNRLSMNSLESDGLENTEEGREVLTYVAKCALSAGDYLVAEVDGVEYEFAGLLGLAPEWEKGALSTSAERMVSACLLAHVNAFGISVPISIRSWPDITADHAEKQAFAVYEATFFGDVFGEKLEAYACMGDEQGRAAKNSSSRKLRVCADDSTDCVMNAVGRCRDVCKTRHPKYGWADCTADGVNYAETTSVYLAPDNATDTVDCADSKDCGAKCVGDDCVLIQDCEGRYCKADCSSGGTCRIDASYSPGTSVTTESGGSTQLLCVGGSKCDATAKNGSILEAECRDADECRVDCKEGSKCVLDCAGSSDCGFTACKGEQRVCGGGIITCNAACP